MAPNLFDSAFALLLFIHSFDLAELLAAHALSTHRIQSKSNYILVMN